MQSADWGNLGRNAPIGSGGGPWTRIGNSRGSKSCASSPCPGSSSSPNAVLPLHIFEHRYKQMTEDALASDRLVTIVMLRPEAEWKGKGSPKLEEYACVGRILKSERLADGKFNFLLLGLRRVRLIREMPNGQLYRTAEAELVDDLVDEGDTVDAQKNDLTVLFRAYLEPYGGVDPDLDEIISSPISAGAPSDRHPGPRVAPPVADETRSPRREASRDSTRYHIGLAPRLVSPDLGFRPSGTFPAPIQRQLSDCVASGGPPRLISHAAAPRISPRTRSERQSPFAFRQTGPHVILEPTCARSPPSRIGHDSRITVHELYRLPPVR